MWHKGCDDDQFDTGPSRQRYQTEIVTQGSGANSSFDVDADALENVMKAYD